MSSNSELISWTNPEYVAAVVSILSLGALVFYSSLTQSGPTVDEIILVGLVTTLPATIAYELARSFQ
ncbi:hypothetical protein [Haladaptatus halobius]|uniref:hypothetical protein n=1 Tax=Haladaptatus halobius TaxID=2884875 RepID=UPI001D0A9C88|nr:hypothetical protein [Haladaptatus halobius]